ncbi:MAG: hypothetical protein E6J20_03645 [Chloroflexi bacterium]|nr:MAG: hypothetical protein E6J20_03645 [Chloroflexota bacterium]
MRQALLGATLLLVAACGAYQFPGETPSPTPATATVNGRVVAVPCSPVQQAGSDCAGRPVQGLELDFIGGQATSFSVVTDASGGYRINLPAGQYVVKLKTYMRVLKGAQNLTVTAGALITDDFLLDSGIRVPAPQA